MNRSFAQRLLAALASIQLTVTLLLVFAVAIAGATLLESSVGTEGARALVYNARWFEFLLVLLVVNLVVLLGRWFPFQPRRTGFFLVHVAMIVILLGAGMTRFLGREGTMHIREGAQSDTMLSREDHVQISDGEASASFPVRLFRPGPVSAAHRLTVGDRDYRVTVKEYWPNFELDHGRGNGEKGALELTVGTDARSAVSLAPGRRERVQGVLFAYAENTVLSSVGDPPLGNLEVRVGGESVSVPVRADGPVEFEVAGVAVAVTEFQSDFTVENPGSKPVRMTNPMVRVELRTPDGDREQRMLFAYHPDFASQHGRSEGALADVEVHYVFERRLLFAGARESLEACASFPLVELGAGSAESHRVIPPGRSFPVVSRAVYRTPENDFSVVLRSAGSDMAAGGTQVSPAVRIEIETADAEMGSAILVKGSGTRLVELGDRKIGAAFGPIRIDLPYALHLDEFVLLTYPGSDRPAGYESHVRLRDPDRGIVDRPVAIRMNSPLTHRGRKHFQNSYDSDNRGTILIVNHDPGKWPTYFGYTLITLGFLLSLLKDLIWPRPRVAGGPGGTRMKRRKVETVTTAGLAGLLAVGAMIPGIAGAADPPADAVHGAPGHVHGAPEGVLELPPDARAEVGRLIMQDFQGRMKPVDTLANEVVRKITKRERYEGWAPLDLYLSWLATADHWWHEPLLYVRHPGLKELLGVSAETSHVSAASLFGGQGDYLLLGHVDAAHRTPDRDRTKLQRKLIAFDERVNLLYLSLQGQTLRIFPIPDDPNDTWDAGSRVIGRLPEGLRPRYEEAQLNLLGGLHDGDAERLRRGVESARAIQAEFGASVLPSDAAVASELFLNRTRLFSLVVWPYLFAFLLLMPAYFSSLLPARGRRPLVQRLLFSTGLAIYLVAFLAHLLAYVLRWIASGYAPLSNGFESLLFISLSVALGGLVFEWRERRGAALGLSALLAFVVLGISMASLFDPAIGLLVPVLNSNWLIIHVTVITASYGFLGLGSALGALILALYLLKAPGRDEVRRAIRKLDFLLFRVLSWGIALLTVGTILGGVWANESWGRYWGWDPKETWSLVTILVYATAQHLRWVPGLDHGWIVAAGSFVGIASIVMTYFGVNYFLTGLHSYASGGTPEVPTWVWVGSALMIALIAASHVARTRRSWEAAPRG